MKDLTKYSYNEQIDRMTLLLKDAEGWGDGFDSSMGQTLIQMVADITDNLHFMLERRTVERYLLTAKIRNSVLTRASELGYRPRRIVGNTGMLRLTIPSPAISEILVRKYDQITYNDFTYTVRENCVIEQGNTTVDIPVIGGVYEQLVFPLTELDTKNYLLIVENYETIENSSLSISSGSDQFFDISVRQDGTPNRLAMSFLSPEDPYYDIRISYDGMRIIMGDDKFGKKPTADIALDFVRTETIADSVVSLNNTFELVGGLFDLDNNPYPNYNLINTSQIRGGMEIETINEIKERAVAYHRTNGRAVTNDDFSYWVKASNIGSIVDCNTFGEHELDSTYTNSNNVYVTYATSTGEDVTLEEKQKLYNYLTSLAMTNVHPILNHVEYTNVEMNLSAKKYSTLEMSDAEFYSILRSFVLDYFAVREGSISKEIQHSEVIKALHAIRVTRNGIETPLVDYVFLVLNILHPFSVPVDNKNAFITMPQDIVVEDGDRFILKLENILCTADLLATDTKIDILNKMRDSILANTPFVARVITDSFVVDGFGNPLPITISENVGTGMLLGAETPYPAPEVIVTPPAIGTSEVSIVVNPASLDVTHYYYNDKAGRRALIPLRPDTTIDFTAPIDTDVLVFVRTVMQDETTEILLDTITAGDQFLFTNTTNYHSMQFEYANDSTKTTYAFVSYPELQNQDFMLFVTTKDGFGSFTVDKNMGDISDEIDVLTQINLPIPSRKYVLGKSYIVPDSLEIVDTNNDVFYKGTFDGRLYNVQTETQSDVGFINVYTGALTIPQELPEGDYYVRYRQNKYQNITTVGYVAAVMPISTELAIQNTFATIEVIPNA